MFQVSPIPTGPLDEDPVVNKDDEVQEQVEVQPGVADEEEQDQLATTLSSPSASPPSLLQELDPLERLLITKRLQVKGVLFLRGKRNRFFVRTPDRNLVYTVEEENRSPCRWWVGYVCYGLRPLTLKVTNGQGQEVMRIDRPYALTSRILPCSLQRLDVYSPPDQLLGTVEQQYTHLKPIYKVKDKTGEDVFWISGPLVTLSCFRDVKFHIQRVDGTSVGATCKRWQGVMHALFYSPVTDRQAPIDDAEYTFGVAFQKDLTKEEKALLLAATLLIEYMYYDV